MIIVFGSSVLDLFFHIADFPSADQACHLETHSEAAGGKGANQAVAAAKAGANVYFYGAMGKKSNNSLILESMHQHEINAQGIHYLPDHPSGLATIFINNIDGTHRIVVSQGANLHAKQSWIEDRHLTPDSFILVQGELPLNETEILIQRAAQRKACTILNFAPAHQIISSKTLEALNIAVVNEYEADALGKQLNISSSDKSHFARELFRQFDLITIVTLGPNGSICCSKEGLIAISSLNIQAIDTTGAGDAFMGYFVAALDAKKSLQDSLIDATIAGALTCTQIGAQSALPDSKDILSNRKQIKIKYL
ncbi:MAG: PfkB family carbohydrate kinase [Pseudomonadota bacterium]